MAPEHLMRGTTMKILLSWLNDYAEFGDDVDALAAAMTSLGLAVDDVEHVGATVAGVVTARVVRTEAHPDAARCIASTSTPATASSATCGAARSTCRPATSCRSR